MSDATKAQLVILVTTLLKIVGGILAAHGVVAIAGVPVDQSSLLMYVEPLVGVIAAVGGFYWSIRQRKQLEDQSVATSRVAVAAVQNSMPAEQLTKAMIAAVPDSKHDAALDKVKALNANGGVPAPK